jgi:transposase
MDRLVLSDAAWERMAPLIIGRPDQKGSTGRDNRMFVEGVLWIVRTGSPWRDLPEAFGDWNSVFRRFSRWSIKGVWWRIFEAMSDDPDFEYLIVDSTIVRAHQHAAGAKKGGLKIKRKIKRSAARAGACGIRAASASTDDFRFAVQRVSLPSRLFPIRAERLAARRRSRCALELAGPGSPKCTLDRRSVTLGRQLPRWRHSLRGSLSLRALRAAGHSPSTLPRRGPRRIGAAT